MELKSKKSAIRYHTRRLLNDLGFKPSLSIDEMYNIGRHLNTLKPNTDIENKIRYRAFKIVEYFINLAKNENKLI